MKMEEGKNYELVVVGQDGSLLFSIETNGKVFIERDREDEIAKHLCDTIEANWKHRQLEMLKLTNNELLFVSTLLDYGDEYWSNHSCDELSNEDIEYFTEEEKHNLLVEFNKWSGNNKTFSKNHLNEIGINSWINFYSNKLIHCAGINKEQ